MSSYFQWDPARLGLQIREMDDEHQVLISLMNKLHVLHESSAPSAAVTRALDELVTYTAKHFADEEAYMDGIGYPGLRVHRGVHKQLLEKLAGLREAFRTSLVLPKDMFVFFKMWLSAHICGIDMKYAHHARARSSA